MDNANMNSFLLLVGGAAVKDYATLKEAEEDAEMRVRCGDFRGTVKVVRLIAQWKPGPPVRLTPGGNVS